MSTSVDVITECRQRLAALLHAGDPTRIVLTTHATQSLNFAVLGLGLAAGDLVVTTVTEHNSVLRPLQHLADRVGIRIAYVPLDEEGALDQKVYQELLDDKPRLVAVNHASNVTGRVNPVAPLFDWAKQAGAITLLDASQSMGLIPVDVSELQADLVAITGHKGLHGPTGTGALFVAADVELEQVFVGGTGVRSDLVRHPADMPVRHEAGTYDMPAFAGLAAALRWVESREPEYCAREQELGRHLRAGLQALSGVTLFDAQADVERTAIASFRIGGWTVEEAGFALNASYGIDCRTGLHCAPLIHQAIGSAPDGTIRFSASGFNTADDIEQALAAVRHLAS